MKNVLLLVHDDAGQESRLQAALDLARALGGHLTCLDVTVMPVVTGELYAFSAEAALFEDEREREEANRQRLQARLEREDVPWSWAEVTGSLAGALEAAAGLADLIVVSRRLDSALIPDMRAVASEVVIGSGKAVVAVPEGAKGFMAAGRALIAWDGSDEAMKAMQAAVPLLRLAETVTILEIDDGTIEIPAEQAAAYLSRHDIRPELVRRPGSGVPAVVTLLAEAKSRGADYVVMGGFGHARIVEALVGGISREMLTSSPIPTLMSH